MPPEKQNRCHAIISICHAPAASRYQSLLGRGPGLAPSCGGSPAPPLERDEHAGPAGRARCDDAQDAVERRRGGRWRFHHRHIKLITKLSMHHCNTLTQPPTHRYKKCELKGTNTKHKCKAWLTSNIMATKSVKNAQRHTSVNVIELLSSAHNYLRPLVHYLLGVCMAWPKALNLAAFPALIRPTKSSSRSVLPFFCRIISPKIKRRIRIKRNDQNSSTITASTRNIGQNPLKMQNVAESAFD